jgi:hypothetical protein
MRFAACLLAIVGAAAVALAQQPIHWSAERKLTKDDFKGRVPAGTEHASLSWINIDTEWECDGTTLVASARASFDPSRSWWRHSQGNIWGSAGERVSSSRAQQDARRSLVERDLQLLEHEQLHFDLAEAVARKIRARFGDFTDACADPHGTDAVREMIVRADRELQEEQQRYDRETSHGLDARTQDQWRRRIRSLLN